MQLEVLTRARYRDPISVAMARSRLGLQPGDDAELADILREVTDGFKVHLGREMARQKYVLHLQGHGEPVLNLPVLPLDPDLDLVVEIDGAAITDFQVLSVGEARLYRPSRWPKTDGLYDTALNPHLKVTCWGGWVMHSGLNDWAASTAKVVGQWIRPTNPASSVYLWECTTAGTTDGSEPDWSTVSVPGGTKTDNDVTWTARRAIELPGWLRSHALLSVLRGWEQRDPSVRSTRTGVFTESYGEGDDVLLSQSTIDALRSMRRS